jgi:hypothetical protein
LINFIKEREVWPFHSRVIGNEADFLDEQNAAVVTNENNQLMDILSHGKSDPVSGQEISGSVTVSNVL